MGLNKKRRGRFWYPIQENGFSYRKKECNVTGSYSIKKLKIKNVEEGLFLAMIEMNYKVDLVEKSIING